MARQAVRVRKIKLLDEGITELLKSEEVEEFLMDVADEIVRDVKTMSRRRSYKAKIHRARKTRSVVNIVDDGFFAKRFEAKHGWLAKAAAKNRD